MSAASTDPPTAARPSLVRWFGRRQLVRLLGKSERTMAWLATDPRSGQDLMLVLPRVQPPDAAAMQRWQQGARQASRLNHPHLAAPIEVGVQDGWPFIAYDPRDAATLADTLPKQGLPPLISPQLAFHKNPTNR